MNRYRGMALILVIAVITGAYLLDRYQRIRFGNQFSEVLFQTARLDVLIDRDIERISTFKLPHYDSLSDYRERLLALLRVLENESSATSKAVRERLQSYIDALRKKLAMMESMISQIGVIRNSLLYLPVILNDQAESSKQEDLLLNSQFLTDLYIHYLFPDKVTIDDLQQQLSFLEASDSVNAIMLNHARLSLFRMERVKELLGALDELDSGTLFTQLQTEFQKYRSLQEKHSLLIGTVPLTLVFLLIAWLWRANVNADTARARAQRAHDRLHDAVESLGEAFALFDDQGQLVLSNRTFGEFFPWLKEYLKPGVSFSRIERMITAKVHRQLLDNADEHDPNGQLSFIEEIENQRWYLGNNYPTSEGGVVCVRTDITSTKKAEHELQKLGRALEQSPASVVITDTQGRIEYVNPKFEEVSGYSAEEVLGKTPAILKSGEKSMEEYEAMWADLKAGKEWLGVFHNRRKDGTMYWESVRISPVRDDKGQITHYIGVKEDITQRKRDQAQILYQATYDLLTNLPNRTLLTDRLTQQALAAQRDQHGFSVMFIDLDRFKVVNDLYGHVTGDELLQQVAVRLQDTVRAADTVSRFGGDEFVVLLHKISKAEDVELVAAKIIRVLSEPFELKQRQVTIGASIGISLYPQDIPPGASIAEISSLLLSNADMAMYQAKALGGNQYKLFERSMQDKMKQYLALEQDLGWAIRNEELEVYYQPIHNAYTGDVDGVEALLRWHHPSLGAIAPEAFIPLAEESGLIGEIGEWVFYQACQTVKRWREEFGLILNLSVNVSARQRDKGFGARTLHRILSDTGFDVRNLTLEITENLLLDESKGSSDWLNDLKQVGVRLAVDDFGTGYSSLSYLKRFPVDSLKIDRSFVQGLPGDKDDVSLVVAIIALADSLGIQVVAEGVETPAQREFLKAQGCDYLQGFLFARPMSAEQLEAHLLDND